MLFSYTFFNPVGTFDSFQKVWVTKMSINLVILFEKRVFKISHVLKFRNKSFEILLSKYPAWYNTEHTLNLLFVLLRRRVIASYIY